MFELFNMGGPLVMGTLTLLLILSVTLAVRGRMKFSSESGDLDQFRKNLSQVRSIGILSLVVGILGQLIGLFSAFSSIEAMGAVDPAMLAAGLKVSLITTIYGALILIISYGLALGLEASVKENN